MDEKTAHGFPRAPLFSPSRKGYGCAYFTGGGLAMLSPSLRTAAG